MIAQNIQALRTRDSLAQEALAERLGVSRQTVAKWESGERSMPPSRTMPMKGTDMRTCRQCGNELESGYIFSTKDGALSFADEVPSFFENARHAPGFVELTAFKIGGRVALPADICRECRRIVIAY